MIAVLVSRLGSYPRGAVPSRQVHGLHGIQTRTMPPTTWSIPSRKPGWRLDSCDDLVVVVVVVGYHGIDVCIHADVTNVIGAGPGVVAGAVVECLLTFSLKHSMTTSCSTKRLVIVVAANVVIVDVGVEGDATIGCG